MSYKPFPDVAPWIEVEPAQGYPVWRFNPKKSFPVLAGTQHECDNVSANMHFGLLNEDGQLACNGQTLLLASTKEELARLPMTGGVGYCYDDTGHEVQYCLAVQMAGASFSPGPPPGRNERGPLIASIVGNSDVVSGMGTRLNAHDQYAFWFDLVTSGDDEPTPEPPTENAIQKGMIFQVKRADAQSIRLRRREDL